MEMASRAVKLLRNIVMAASPTENRRASGEVVEAYLTPGGARKCVNTSSLSTRRGRHAPKESD
jgi:hypothetical protein